MEKTEPGYAQQMIEARGQGHERLGNGNKGKVLDQKMRRATRTAAGGLTLPKAANLGKAANKDTANATTRKSPPWTSPISKACLFSVIFSSFLGIFRPRPGLGWSTIAH